MSDMASRQPVLFEEVQRTTPTASFGIFIAGGTVIVGSGLFAASRGELSSALPGLVFGAAVIAGVTFMISAIRMRSRVTTAEATFAYGRFGTVRLGAGDIASAEMVRFGMFSGGIGYHIGFGSTAITARTGDGVRIIRPDGRRVLVGTQQPEALYSALLRLQAGARRES